MSTPLAYQVFAPPAAELAAIIAAGDLTVNALSAFRDAGGDVDSQGDRGVTLLHWALLNKQRAALDLLLSAGANAGIGDGIGVTPVHVAAMANDPAYLDTMLSHRIDPNTPNTISQSVPLTAAIMGARDHQLNALLDAGADVDRPDRLGNTPLHQAAKINDLPRVLHLLQAGANPAIRNAQNATFADYLSQADVASMPVEARTQRQAIAQWITVATY